MRVGILLGNSDPTAGGGYTFQKEVFDALLAIGAQSRHSFVFLCHPDTATKLPPRPLPNAEVVALDVEAAAQRSALFGRSRPAPPVRSLDEQLQAARIEFVWQLSAPGQVLDVPYMVVVWDLQHRLQPWFPEVSANGNWQHRDSLYTAVLGRAAAVIVGTEAGKLEVERFFRVDPSRILIMPHPTPRSKLSRSRAPRCCSSTSAARWSGPMELRSDSSTMEAASASRGSNLQPQTVTARPRSTARCTDCSGCAPVPRLLRRSRCCATARRRCWPIP